MESQQDLLRFVKPPHLPSEPVTWLYGDSFLHFPATDSPTWWALIHDRRPAAVVDRSEQGSGIERAIWWWISDHSRSWHRPGDLVIITLSEASRFFQTDIANVNASTAMQDHSRELDPEIAKRWRAIEQYYRHLLWYQLPFLPIRTQALSIWLDQQLATSPAETWVAESFPLYPDARRQPHYDRDPPQEFSAARLEDNIRSHWFKNARNIWPSLMYFSLADREGNRFGADTRPGHLTWAMHDLLAQKIRSQRDQGGDFLLETPPSKGVPTFQIRQF